MDTSIPAGLAFQTPIYIHSHAKNLEFAAKNARDNAKIQAVIKKIHSKGLQILTNATNVMKGYKNNPALQKFYNDRHKGTKRDLSDEDQKLLNELINFRQTAINFRNESNNTYDLFFNEFLGKRSNKTLFVWLQEKLGKSFINEISESLVKEFKSANANKKNVKFDIKNIADFKKLTKKDVLNDQNELQPIISSILRKVLGKEIKKSDREKVKKYLDDFHKKILDRISNIEGMQPFLQQEATQKLIARIEKINSNQEAYLMASVSGFYFELIYPLLLQSKISNTDINVAGQQLEFMSDSSEDHSVTSDTIVKMLDDSIAGITLKFKVVNGQVSSRFTKTQSILQEEHTKIFDGEADIVDLLYFLANKKAYSLFAAPLEYKTVIVKQGDNFKITYPRNEKKAFNVKSEDFAWFNDLKTAYAGIGFVKAFLGSVFLNKDQSAIKDDLKKLAAPVWIGFGDSDYWTYDILERLTESYGSDPEDLLKNFQQYIKLSGISEIPKSDLFSGMKDAQKLKDLFVAKKVMDTAEKATGNRIKRIIEGSRLPEYNVSSIPDYHSVMTELSSGFTIKNLVDTIVNGVKFSIDIESLFE